MKRSSKKKTPKKAPVMVQGGSFGDLLDQLSKLPPPKPMSKKDQAEVNDLLKQLIASQGPGGKKDQAEVNDLLKQLIAYQGPGDSLMMFNVSPKKPK